MVAPLVKDSGFTRPSPQTRVSAMTLRLDQLQPGQTAQVVELRSTDPARLDRLGGYGLAPGSWVRVEQRYPALIFRVGGTELSVDWEVARQIIVQLE